MNLQINQVISSEKKNIPDFDNNLGFGKYFSDHMFLMEYSNKKWGNPRIEQFHNISLPPSAMVFHYGQAIFEGMKAYRNSDNLYLFRPMENMRRMNNSANRLVMPEFDSEFALSAIKKLVEIDSDWIPEKKGYSLYIRPTMIATEPYLGVRPSESYLFYVIVGPAGPYYSSGFAPVDIFVTENYVRSVKGGVGEAKAAGNYASSLLAQVEGQKAECQQVLWLDGRENKYIEEVGAMNLFVKFKDRLVTPELSGSILPGITRDSVIKISESWGTKVSQEKLSIEDLIEGISSGEVHEIFGCGTAAVIAPVKSLTYKGEKFRVSNGLSGEFSTRLFNFMTSLQQGEVEDEFNFVYRL
ncbi:branched-chain amino acid aminotransferase [Bacteriovoracaceae bacterium]|nr:branched-chain amino acid aminotransferase [Bacteriovoracaceae bacterium]